MTAELINITKEAGVLRTHLQNGKLDIKETIQFLARVERLNNPPKGKNKARQRFEKQLNAL